MLRLASLSILAIGLMYCTLARTHAAESSIDDAAKQVLDEWQKHRATSFYCSFTRWNYDLSFGVKEKDYLVVQATGILQFSSLDRWNYQVDGLKRFDCFKNEFVVEDGRERWMCDGKSLYEFDFRMQELTESVLSEEDRPKSFWGCFYHCSNFWLGGEWQRWITDAKLVRDHAGVKVITPPKSKDEYWLEIRPTEERVQRNFEMLELILDAHDFRTKAVQLYQSGSRNRTVYVFTPSDKLTEGGCQFFTRATPTGWKHVVNQSEDE